jgi:transposase
MKTDKERIAELELEVANLKKIIHTLLEELSKYKNPKNSHNSSIPPSKDENRPFKTNSLRSSSGKHPGGQAGHEGNTLKMTDSPNRIVECKPEFCNHCGNDLSSVEPQFIARRQVVDVPPIDPEYVEYHVYSKLCTCGHQTQSPFPAGVNSPISYGPNIEAMIAYLHTRQYIPFDRMAEYFSDVCNLPISQGTICEILDRFEQKALPAYQLIAKEIETSKVVGSDETGAKVNGKMGWYWTWQSKLATFIAFSNNRGTATINTNFSKGFVNAVLVHDCWKSHFETKVKNHQLCTAHLLRELIFFEERFQSKWATEFKQLLYDAMEFKKILTPAQYYRPMHQRTELIDRLTVLLQTPIPENMKELQTFHNRMNKYKNYIFTFLYSPDVPPDNNASERAIRNIKVKLKVSGQFKTVRGAQIYATIRSVTDTCIKNGQNILQAFNTIANLQPE